MLNMLLRLFMASTGPAQPPQRSGKRKWRKTESEFTSYYGRPVIKKPHWVWPIWGYFWAGGIVSGASALATLTELWGDKDRDRSIIRAGRYISLAGMVVSPVLLIIDLQRPERFHHMLRVLKLRSPLSVGTYILTTTGLLAGLNASRQLVEDGLLPAQSLPGKLALLSSNGLTSSLQGLDGLALGGYTGVLLSATAVPLWAENELILPPLFLASAFSTGAAAIGLARVLGGVATEDLHRLDPIERGAIVAELALLGYGLSKTKPAIRKAALGGLNGWLFGLAVVLGQLGPLLLQLLASKNAKSSRALVVLNALLVLTGGFFLRVAVVEAGKATADDADAYHATTRATTEKKLLEQ